MQVFWTHLQIQVACIFICTTRKCVLDCQRPKLRIIFTEVYGVINLMANVSCILLSDRAEI